MKHSGFLFCAALCAAVIFYLGWQIYQTASARSALFKAPASYVIDGKNSDLKIAEFFSYDCVPCQDLQPELNDALAQDGHVTYIPRAMPSDDDASVHMAVLAYAAAAQGKFTEMHTALLRNTRPVTKDVLNDLARQTGVDLTKLGDSFKDKKITDYLDQNAIIYNQLDLKDVPVFLIGKDIVYSPPYDVKAQDFLKLFAAARAKK